MAVTCHHCSTRLPFHGASCRGCEGNGFPRLETVERSPLEAQLLRRLRAATSGEFEIVRAIGHGGMARVYLAYDLALDRQIALKVLSPLFSEYPEIVRRFQQEARTAAQLSHPHIVPVFTVYQGNGLCFFTMPFVEGSSVRRIIDQTGRLEVETALDYVRQAAAGLSYAHEHGVVHRDVKPENMLLERNTNRLMLTDFGLAKALGSESLTIPGDLIGTPQYMAPEQCESGGSVDARSDQYSLALVAYEMLAGEYPFKGEGLRELLMKRLSVDPPPLRSVRPDVPDPVSRAIERGLSRNAEERFPTIEAFIRGLAGIQQANGRAPGEHPLNTLIHSLNDRVSRVFAPTGRVPRRESSTAEKTASGRWKEWSIRAAVVVTAAASCYLAIAAMLGDETESAQLAAGEIALPAPSSFIELPPPGPDTEPAMGPPRPSGARNDPMALAAGTAGRSDLALAGARHQLGDLTAEAGSAAPDNEGSNPSSLAAATPGRGDARSRPRRLTRERSEDGAATTSSADRPSDADGSKSSGERNEEPAGSETGTSTSDESVGDVADAEEGAAAEASSEEPLGLEEVPAARPPSSLLEDYRRALEQEDLESLRALYVGELPSEEERFLARIFENAESIEAGIDLVELEVDGEMATASVEFPLSYILTKTRWSREHTLKMRLQLERRAAGWRIAGSKRG